MVAVARREKVVSIVHFQQSFCLCPSQSFFFNKLGTIVCIDGTAKTQKNMPTHLDSLLQLGVAFQTGIERRPVPQAPRWLLHISSSAQDGDTSPRRTKRFRTHIRSNCTHARPLIDG